MPRKQRFKPSRKPKPTPEPSIAPVESRPEVHPDDVELGVERGAPAEDVSAPDVGKAGGDSSR